MTRARSRAERSAHRQKAEKGVSDDGAVPRIQDRERDEGGHELAHLERLNSCLCLFDEGRRGRYLFGYICARFEMEALNQGPACFGWRLTNEPMTTSPAWLRSLSLRLSTPFSSLFILSPVFSLSLPREQNDNIFERAREHRRDPDGSSGYYICRFEAHVVEG